MIQVEHLTKRFRRQAVLDDLSLRFEPGERVALVGANGAGKTTLVRCLLGEYQHDGSVRIGGLPPRGARRQVLRRIGFVPQAPPPLRMQAGQLVRFTADLCGTDPAAIAALSDRLGLDLDSVRRQPFAKLSGGQKQKLLIACALGRGCDLLFLDEPAANLDPPARRSFFELLAERVGSATMLISSHRLDEVAALVRRVVELDHGRVVLDDRVDDGAALAVHLRCRITLSRADPAAARALGEWGFGSSDDGLVFAGRVAGPDRLRLLGTLARHAGLIADLKLEPEPEAGASP